jgi:SAM-dependent methyltransferase
MDQEYGANYARTYREHWWWRAREAILLDILRGLSLSHHLDVLDVGCGDAVSFPVLSEFGTVRGIEVDETLLDPSGPYRDRISTRLLGDPIYSDPEWTFDLITALDVIEHIEDDRAAVASMVSMLRPDGLMILTVPAFELLWDHHDDINHHFRRYTVSKLRSVLEGQGLKVLQLRYAFRSLFLPKLVVRLVNLSRFTKVAQHGIPADPINKFMCSLCLAEDRLLRRVPIPFGTSVLAVLHKPA